MRKEFKNKKSMGQFTAVARNFRMGAKNCTYTVPMHALGKVGVLKRICHVLIYLIV